MAALATQSILGFTLHTKPDFRINWHHAILGRYLDKFVAGDIKRLIVSMPPRHGKSELVSRRLPAYAFGKNPNTSIISCSYGADLASRMNRDVQRIMESPSYAQVFPNSTLNESNVRSVANGSYLRNSDIFEIVGHKGVYRSAGVGGGITGMGGDIIIVDDPIKNKEEAESQVYRDKIWDWYTSTLYTRLEKDAGILITMTRWHEDDLIGRLLDKKRAGDEYADKWAVVEFPAIKETDLNPIDPRQIGEPLWPWKFSKHRLLSIKATSGSKDFSALYQQKPSPAEGNIVKREWWRFYTVAPEMDKKGISADLTFKKTKKSDYTVLQVWGRKGADKYLLDQVRDKMGFNAQLTAMRALAAKWDLEGVILSKWVEDAANANAMQETLQKEIAGIILVPATTSKVLRAETISPQIQSGNVYLPDPSIAPWVNDYIEEWAAFPNSTHDDQVDATSLGVLKISDNTLDDWSPGGSTAPSKWNR